jgi:hypothetical protein
MFKRTKDWNGYPVTLDGETYTIIGYSPDDKWCHITKDGTEPTRVSALWACQRAAWYVKDQSFVGKWFSLANHVFWKCVDRYKGRFVLEDPKTGRQTGFHTDFSRMSPYGEPTLVPYADHGQGLTAYRVGFQLASNSGLAGAVAKEAFRENWWGPERRGGVRRLAETIQRDLWWEANYGGLRR